MPHIIVKLYPGKSEQDKKDLTKKIVENVVSVTQCKETAVSVAIEEIQPDDWAETVYRPDIMDGPGILYKQPGYDPFSSKQEKKEETTSLMDHVREAAKTAEKEDASGQFNAMSWLDLTLEDNPEFFDTFFDTPWNEMSDGDRQERMVAIRRVL